MKWKTQERFDLILCTGGVHHIPYDKQEDLIKLFKSLLTENGKLIVADPYIDDFNNEKERKISATKLGYEYILATIKNKAPDEIIKASIDILYNDVLKFEYKTSLNKIMPLFQKHFIKKDVIKTWPMINSEYGDYILTFKK